MARHMAGPHATAVAGPRTKKMHPLCGPGVLGSAAAAVVAAAAAEGVAAHGGWLSGGEALCAESSWGQALLCLQPC
eukprot:1160486-Pelagomonas_calceolata.AAC.4